MSVLKDTRQRAMWIVLTIGALAAMRSIAGCDSSDQRLLQQAETACQRLGLPQPIHQTVRLFSSAASGLCVQLPDWRYPLVCDLASGQVQYDNYGGQWGDQQQFDRFLQAYAVEKAKIEARRQGHSIIEQPLADGSIKLVIQVGGGAA